MGEIAMACRRFRTLRAIVLIVSLGGIAGLVAACGVKAAPRPPGVKAAVRGERAPDCDGFEIPGPDAYPSPSTPSVGTGSAGVPTQADGEPTKEGEDAAGGASGAEGDGAAGNGPW